jgi:hypothetical protein
VKKANARGFAMDVKLIAKPLMVKTQAKYTTVMPTLNTAAPTMTP